MYVHIPYVITHTLLHHDLCPPFTDTCPPQCPWVEETKSKMAKMSTTDNARWRGPELVCILLTTRSLPLCSLLVAYFELLSLSVVFPSLLHTKRGLHLLPLIDLYFCSFLSLLLFTLPPFFYLLFLYLPLSLSLLAFITTQSFCSSALFSPSLCLCL